MYVIATQTSPLYRFHGNVKSASADWIVLGVELFQRLELFRILAVGTGGGSDIP